MKVHFSNLGCKLNQAELEKLARDFNAAGHQVVSSLEVADLHVINSCTVTHIAARKSRKIARRGHKLNPEMRSVLTGCFASERPQEAGSVPGVDLVVTNDQKDHLLTLVHEAFPDLEKTRLDHREPNSDAAEGIPVPYVPLEFGNSRALVKVEDGCNMRCSFCIIPMTRGSQKSRALDDCVEEVEALAQAGHQEVVITGVQISAYRWEGQRLVDLVREILDRTTVPRLRLTSIAPWQLDDRLLELWKDRRLCRHLHISLQSGCTETLARMRRPYSSDGYAKVLDRVRQAIPGVAITTDVIVGFPGETQEEFDHSLRFVERMDFAKIHVFPYSQRQGTLAASLEGAVPHPIKQERVASMLEVARRAEENFLTRNLGICEDVLWEGKKQGLWHGFTDNYVRVFARHAGDLSHRLIPTRLVALSEGGVDGDLQLN
ncbi:MAG: tRNA (N(6)-L-threonylcarbamoyladenosine(37)-C(2))-methylthiotransferase MtaB [Deltaproteobacteria bacterium]|nr:tRNA (N(6)-L-threonylcarbamoyladenosine(37)-C(2))-methylthiotransferase MtaB [Deltaproteobacteria bacterium]